MEETVPRPRKLIGYAFLCLILVISAAHCRQAGAEPWKFAVVCDTRGDDNDTPGKKCINEYILKMIAQSIVDEGCKLVIVPGDMVNGWWANGKLPYDQQFKNWKSAMQPVYDKMKVYTVRGNHEDGSSTYPPQTPYATTPDPTLKEAYLENFGNDNPQNGPEDEKGLTYYFTNGNAFFIGLDEYVHPYQVNFKWLTEIMSQKLNRKETPHVFVFGHCPAFQVTHPDCLAFYKKQRDQFWDILGSNGAKIYFCGHDHLYNRLSAPTSKYGPIFQALVGSCGAPMKPWSPPYSDPTVTGNYHNEKNIGYMVVTVDGSQVKAQWKVWDPDGSFKWAKSPADEFSYSLN